MSDNKKKAIELLDQIVASGRVRKSSGSTSGAGSAGAVQGNNSTRTSVTKESPDDYIARRKKELGLDVSIVDDIYIDSFLKDASSYNSSNDADWSRIGIGSSNGIYQDRKQMGEDLSSRSSNIRRYLNENKDSLPEEYYNEFMTYLDNFDRWNAGSLYGYYRQDEYYSQFESQAHYDAVTKSTDEIKAILDAVASAEDDSATMQSLILADMPLKSGLETGTVSPVAYTTKDGQNVTWQSIYDSRMAAEDLESRYGAYSKNADWDANSQVINFGADTQSDYDILFELSRTLIPYDWETAEASGVDLATFEDIEGKRQYISEKYGVDLYADVYNNVNIFNDLMAQVESQPGETEAFEYLSYLTDQEREVLSYIYQTEGRAAALEWHNSRIDIYEDRFNGVMVDQLAHVGADNPFWGSVGSTALSISSGFEYLGDIMSYMATGEMGDNTSARASGALQSGVMQSVDWEIANWDAFDFLYGNTMSGVNSAVNTFLFGPMSGVMQGLGAAAQATNDAMDRGVGKNQAFFTGVAAGVFECLFESWSIGNFNALKEVASANAWDIAMNIGKSMLVNASEEFYTEVANITYDMIMNGDFSQYETLVRQYVVNGMSEKEAKTQAALDLGWQITEAFIGGGLMGLGFGAAGQTGPIIGNAIDAVNQSRYNSNMARGTIKAEGGVDALRNLANEVAGVSDPKMQRRLNRQAGAVEKNATTRNVRNLYKSVNNANSAKHYADVKKALTERGFVEYDAEKLAKAVVASADGKILTNSQEKLLESYKGNDKVQEALKETGMGAMARSMRMGVFEYGVRTGNVKGFAAASSAEQAAPGQEKTGEKGNLPGEEKGASYEVSEDGKTHLISDPSKDVTVKGIASIKDGKMMLEMDDGSSVAAEDVSFGNEGDAIIYSTVASMNVSADTANVLVKGFNPEGDISAPMYALDIKEAYNFGQYNYPLKAIENDPYAAVKKQAWNEGRIDAIKSSKREQLQVNAETRAARDVLKQEGKTVSGKYHAVLEQGITEESMTESQRLSFQMADQIAQAAKVNIQVYDGKTGEWGYYSHKNDMVYLNLNATNKSAKSMMAFVLGHELVHRAKVGSPAKYQAFADFLMEQYGKQGSDIEAMIGEELRAAREHGIRMTRDQAFEEVVADACQRMLLDTDAGKKLARFGAESQQNRNLVDQIRKWIKEFMDKLREMFRGVDPDSRAAREFAKFDEGVKQILADMYVDMTIDAGAHLSTIRTAFGKDTVVKTNEDGEFTMAQNADGSEKIFNLVTWKNGGRETMEATLAREGYTKEEIKAALTIMDAKQQLVEDIANEVNENGAMAFPEQGRINEATLTTDIKDGHAVLSALVSNGDYPVNIDLLMVCKKRKAYQRVINRLCETGMIQQATVDALAIAEINKILGKYGFETACLGCFVESRRLRIQEWAQTIVKEWNGEVKKRDPNAKPFGFGKGEAKLDADEIMQLIGELESGGKKNDQGNLNLGQGSAVKRMGVLLDKVPSLRRTLAVEDLITPDGLSALRRFDGNLFSMVKSRYGSNSPKFVQEFNPYNHELAKYGTVPTEYKSLREYLYAIGGARMQSFSDFIVENWFDYCQIVADLAARKLPMHTYTKEIALAKLFGMTGIKINMSLIPDIDRSMGKEYAGLTRNADGKLELIWADKDRFKATGGTSYMQSINFADAIALQNDPRYSANVGTIAIGVSDRQIRMMLADPRIRMVIPYHSSGMNPIFADLMGTSYYKDYTNYQNTTVKQVYNSKGQPVSLSLDKTQTGKLTGGFLFNTSLQELGDARAAAEAYKAWCADASLHTITIKGETYTAELTPKFDDFKGEPNYYKLLEDFNPYDCITEAAAPQGDVQQVYPEGFEDILRAELKGQEKYRQKQEKNQAFDKAMGEIESYLQNHSKADTVHYANQHGIKLGAKDKKLNAADKAKLKQLQQEGVSFSLPKLDQEYMDAVERGDMVTAQRMVNERAEALRAEVFAQTDVPTYRIRRGPAPKKTIKVYKVFTMSSAGKPSALFVSSQYDLPVGVWLDAQDTYHFTDQRNGHMYVPSTKNPNTKGGATGRPTKVSDISDEDLAELERRGYLKRGKDGKFPKSITSLAYRPGWHAGDLPFFPQGGMQIDGSNYPNVHRYNQVVFECEMIADHDYTNYHVNDDGRVVLHDMQEMPMDGSYKYSTNPMAQSTDIGSWYIGSSIRIVRALTQEECDQILQENGRPVQEWQAYQDAEEMKKVKAAAKMRYTDKNVGKKAAEAAEYEYEHRYGPLNLDALGYDPNQTDGGKKLLDAVTYDDNGDVIPLSQRFNPEVDDVRYSLPKSKKADPEGYDTTKIHWAIEAGIIDRANQRAFWEQIANIRKLGYYNITTDDGEYAIKAGNAIMFTDADYKAPSLTSVIVVKAPDKRTQDYVTRWIIDEISEYGSVEYAYELVSGVYGQELVSWYHQKDFYSYDWEGGQREGSDGRGADSESGSRGIRHRNKLPVGEDSSPRALLANAFEGVAQNDIERRNLKQYQERVEQLNADEAKLQEIRAEIKELSFAKGKKDTKRITELKFEANATANRIATLDKMLLRFEASAPLMNILQREKDMVRQRERQRAKEDLEAYRNQAKEEQKVIAERYQESRKKIYDSRKRADMRQKIRKVIRDLDKLLNRGDKKQNVKEGMKDLVAEALNSAEILFIDNYTNEDMVRDGVGTDLTPGEAKHLEKARALMEQIENLPSGSYEAMMARQEEEAKLKGQLAYRMSQLRDVFVRERARLNRTQVAEVLAKLAEAYKSLESAEQSYVRDGFHENVYQFLQMLQSEVGGTIVKDMSLGQLESLYKAYTMVLTTVRNANKMFAANLKDTRDTLANRVMFEVQKAGGDIKKLTRGGKLLNSFSWNNLKPVYAFQRIGSNTLSTLFGNVRKGQDTWARDIQEADAFRREINKKHDRKSWDMEKRYSFTSSSGIDFELSLEQIMSLYAYSKREQAHEHLLKGGFVFDGNTEVVETKNGIKRTYLVENATAHNVSVEILSEIISTLTDEQKAYVDEMQDYLSTVMGEKGNEVSMQLYGVKLFNEQNYFPLRSAGQYMERAKEADLKKEQGQVNIVNSGFAKATTPKASNPVVLSGFMDVWASHVNEMGMYHSFVLPMEDFRRVYNYSSPNMEGQPSVSVNQVIQNAHGSAATAYIDQLYRDLNGGAVSDPRETVFKSMVGKFKKASVFASASVVVQQPSAVGRAFALIDPKYFIGPRVDAKRHKLLWQEVKKYAPVAFIKEMGYFDTGMGRSAVDFLKAEEYTGLKEQGKALIADADFRDEVIGWLPAKADELTWAAIWEAVKRETADKHPDMDVKSEEFLQLAGERFSEIIDRTQVYDSVLARSANMRSKSLFMNMATAFMGEPTTSINMIEDAVRQGKQGDKKAAARTIAAVYTSVLINSMLVSLVYAARDDDEDETLIEKYLSSFVTEMLDGMNLITYYPFLKDVWSLLQGWDIERADMSIIADVISGFEKLVKAYSKDTADLSASQLEQREKDIVQGWWGTLESVASLFGLPLKNIRRDINGARNLFDTIRTDLTGRNTTLSSLWDVVWGDIKDTMPVVGWMPSETKGDKLYDALVRGDDAYAERLMSTYKDEKAVNSAVRKAIEKRYKAGEIDASTALKDLFLYAGVDAADALWVVDEWDYEMAYGDDYQKYGDFFSAVESGQNLDATIKRYLDNGVDEGTLRGQITSHFKPLYMDMTQAERAAIRPKILDAMVRTGAFMEEAEDALYEWDFEVKHGMSYNDMVAEYKDGNITRDKMFAILRERGLTDKEAETKLNEWDFVVRYGIDYSDREMAYMEGRITTADLRAMYEEKGKSPEEIENLIEAHEWLKAHPQYDLYASTVVSYIKPLEGLDYSIEDTGMDVITFADELSNIGNIRGESGVYNSRIVKAFPYIDSLPLTSEQKTALAVACGWSLKTVEKNKLW